MRLHLTARPERRLELAAVAATLTTLGHRVTSRWLRGFGHQDAETALFNLTDVVAAEGLVLFSDATADAAGPGDHHVELGYALRAGRHVFVVGPPTSGVHLLPDVAGFDDTEAFLRHFEVRR